MKILVIEDEVRITSLLKKGLEKEGHTVDIAHNADDGWQIASDGHFDVIILDVKLPDMDGMELCKKFRSADMEIPILMLTARDSVDDKVTGLMVGADDYLTKPFSFEELRARLTALVRRPPQFVDTSLLQVRDLVLHPTTYEVKQNGIMLSLTRKEFAVLELLMLNANQVLSRDIILDRVWGAEMEPVTNVVDAVIARLRMKIDKHTKGRSFIKTVRGVGYKIQ